MRSGFFCTLFGEGLRCFAGTLPKNPLEIPRLCNLFGLAAIGSFFKKLRKATSTVAPFQTKLGGAPALPEEVTLVLRDQAAALEKKCSDLQCQLDTQHVVCQGPDVAEDEPSASHDEAKQPQTKALRLPMHMDEQDDSRQQETHSAGIGPTKAAVENDAGWVENSWSRHCFSDE